MNKDEFMTQLAEAFGQLGTAIESIKSIMSEEIEAEGTDEYNEFESKLEELEEELNDIPYGCKSDIKAKKEEIAEVEKEMEEYINKVKEEASSIQYKLDTIDWYDIENSQYRIWEELGLGEY